MPGKSSAVDVIRREYENKFDEASGIWQSVPKDIPVYNTTATTNDKGEASITYTPPQAGSYKIIAKSTDNGGREVRAVGVAVGHGR